MAEEAQISQSQDSECRFAAGGSRRLPAVRLVPVVSAIKSPNAAASLKLAEQAYEAGETSFVQVLVARRKYFDSNLQFVQAQSQLAQDTSMVDGYVLTGGLDAVLDNSGGDSLRELTVSQQ